MRVNRDDVVEPRISERFSLALRTLASECSNDQRLVLSAFYFGAGGGGFSLVGGTIPLIRKYVTMFP